MKYPEELDKILNEELKKLIELNKNKDKVFDHEILIAYNKEYEKIKENTAKNV